MCTAFIVSKILEGTILKCLSMPKLFAEQNSPIHAPFTGPGPKIPAQNSATCQQILKPKISIRLAIDTQTASASEI